MITKRQQALDWWRNLPLRYIIELKPRDRYIETLTGREIEYIWEKTTQTK